MRNPAFKVRLVRFLVLGSTAVAATAMAQPPETGSSKRAASRTRPQIIYHLPRSSNYAGTLHSQAKSQNSELPNDSAMPNPIQNSRPDVNPAVQPQQQAPQPSFQQQRVKPKVKANRSQARPHSFAKPPGGGNPHGKSHKK
jgi:hypothetical protein